jgi:hypothetical protein
VADLPQPEGSFAELNNVDVDASIRLLTALATFGNWKCGTSTPDLPSDYPEGPSISHVRNLFVNGINALEAKALKARKTSESTRASMTKFIFNKIGVPSAEWSFTYAAQGWSCQQLWGSSQNGKQATRAGVRRHHIPPVPTPTCRSWPPARWPSSVQPRVGARAVHRHHIAPVPAAGIRPKGCLLPKPNPNQKSTG